MRLVYGWITISLLLLAGCSKPATAPATSGKLASNGAVGARSADTARGADTETADAGTPADAGNGAESGTAAYAVSGPVPIANGVVDLSPANTKIQFVGTHVGPKPDPNARIGGFEKFTGQARVDPASKKLQSVAVDIETGSLWSPNPNLTTHLNTVDFLDTREYPKAKFESTRIEPGASPGEHTITGNLTLLAATKEVTVPALVTVDDAGLTLKGDFKIDRTEYGMDRMQDRVEKEVTLSIVIGEKTEPQKGAGGPGGGGRRGNFDPVAMFRQRDADGDGKLTGDEIHERMRQDMAELDGDKDGAVSLEEFQARMRRFGGGQRGGGPGAGGAGGTPPNTSSQSPSGEKQGE
jgi:polyisoprenoid-binding protein YceI